MAVRFGNRLALAVCAAATLASSAQATTYYWDQTGGGTGGGTGAWDTSSSFWRPGSLAGSLGPYGNATSDGVVLGGTAGTLTIATGGVNANNITFLTTGYTIVAPIAIGTATSPLTLSGINPLIDTGTFSASINGNLAGTAGFTKTGAGTLTLGSATAATTSGTTTNSSTTVTVASTAGMIVGMPVSGAGAPAGATVASITDATHFVLSAAVGAAAGTTGTMTFQSINTWTGAAYVNAGTLTVQTPQAATATFALNNGAALTTNQTLAAANTATILSGSSTITGTTSTAFLGAYLGSGNVTWNGGSTNQTNYNTGLWANYGGTFTFGNNSGGRINSATVRAEYATINLGSGTTTFYSSTANANIILGAVQAAGTGTILSSVNVASSNANWIVGSVNSDTTFAGTFATGLGNATSTSSLVKVGTGTLTLTGASTGTSAGNLTVNGGTLKLDYGTNNTGIWKSTGTLGFGGGSLSLLGKSTGTSTQTLGAVTVNAGGSSLIVDNNGGSGTTLTLGGITATAAGGTLNILPPSVSLVGTAGTITTTTNKSADGTYGGRITYGSDWASTASGSSPYTLSAYSGYTAFVGTGGSSSTNYSLTGSGTVTATESFNSLKLLTSGASQSLGIDAGQTLTLTNGGILFAGTNNYTIGAAVDTGTLKSNTATNSDLIIHQLGTGSLTINSVIANGIGTSTLTKAGAGTLILAGTNTYTGQTYLNGGITSIGANVALGAQTTGATLNLNGGTLQATGTFGLFNGTAGTNNRAVTIGGGGGTFDVTGSNTLTVAGVISNAVANQFGPLIKTGTGTLTLTGANTYNGQTIINGGTISVATVGNAGANSTLGNANASAPGLVLNNGTLLYTGATGSTNRSFTVGTGGGTIDSSGTGALTFSNVTNTLATGSGARTLTLTGTYTGADNSMGLAIANPTSGATSVTKAGAGTWVLANVNNTYTGATTVSAGTLKLTSATSTNNIANSATVAVNSGTTLNVNGLLNSRIILANGQTLKGSGTVVGGVTASSGSILTPGDSGVGTLSVGSLTLNTGSITNFEFTNASTYDVIAVSTASSLVLNGGGFNLYATGTTNPWLTTGTAFNLFTYTGSAPDVTALNAQTKGGVLNFNLGLTYTWAAAGGNVSLTLSGTPTVISTWTGSSGGAWATASNWDTNPIAPGGSAGDSATFTTAAGGGTVDLGTTNETLGVLGFNSTAAYNLSGSTAQISLNNGSGNAAQINDLSASGSNTVSVPLAITADGVAVSVTNSGETLNLNGAITGSGPISKGGAGTLALAGANTSYSGNTTLNAGTLQLGNTDALGSGQLTITANSTLQAGASVAPANNIVINAGVTATVDTQANTLTLGGVLSQSGAVGALTKIGSGTLILSGTNTYAGATTISNGTLQLGNAGATGSVAGIIVNNGALVINRSNSFSLGNVISGSGSLNQAGAGNTTLSVANTFTGNTIVSSGSLILGTALALQNSTLNYNNQGGTFSFGALTAASLGGLTGAQNLVLTNSTPAAVALTVGGNNDVTTYTGLLSGLGSLNKTGTGVLTIGSGATGGATYSGTTTTAGTLTLGGVTNLTGQFFAPNGGTLTFADTAVVNTGANGLAFATANFTGGTITVKDSSQVSFASLTFGAGGTQQSAANSVTVQDSATLSITGALDLNASGGSNNSASNTALNLNGGVTTVGNIATSGGSALHQSTINFNGGQLRPTASNANFLPVVTGQTAKVQVGGAKINTNGFDITIGAVLTSGVVNDGGFTKSGSGTLTLSGTNTYTGTTTVSTGTLAVAGSGTLGVGNLQIASGATVDISGATTGLTVAVGKTLSGEGTILGTGKILTVDGALSPGTAGIGALTMDGGTLALTSNSTFAFTLGDPSVAALSDRFLFTGTTAIDFGSGVVDFSDFTFTPGANFGVGTYTLFGGATSFTGSLGAGLNGTIGGFNGTLALAGNDLTLIVAVPEPHEYAVAIGGLLFALIVIRRRKARMA